MKFNREETIRVVNLETGYTTKKEKIVVTRDINASLFSRELTCLLGPNGAGKSTLLKTLTTFIPPLKGEIFILNKSLKDYSEADLAKIIGVVLTDKLSINDMTVEELVALGRSPYTGFWGKLTSHDRTVIDESISLVGIDNLRLRSVRTLSDGERQKVMIAKALAQETPIIFLDEPTAFLDYPSKVEIMQLLQRLSRERNKTVFLSTHDLELALQIADKVWLLDKSHGVTVGTPEDLALRGDMTRYFQRKGITFDVETGLFQINHALKHKVYLLGEGAHANLVRKALARRGIEAVQLTSNKPDSPTNSSEDSIKYTIKADDRGYHLQGDVITTVEELLDRISQLLDS